MTDLPVGVVGVDDHADGGGKDFHLHQYPVHCYLHLHGGGRMLADRDPHVAAL